MKRSADVEKAIIAGLQEGGNQRRIFERKLYEHFFSFIRKGVWKYGLDEDLCASIYSDTIISVIQNIVRRWFKGNSSLGTYMYQIFLNKCVDEMRKKTTKKGRVLHETREIDSLITNLPDGARNVVQQMIDQNDHSLLMQVVNGLGEKCRELLVLFADDYTDQEIARQMHYNSAEVVKTTRLRCLEKLREKVIAKKSND